MGRYAIIHEGIVSNIAEAEDEYARLKGWVPATGNIGDTFDPSSVPNIFCYNSDGWFSTTEGWGVTYEAPPTTKEFTQKGRIRARMVNGEWQKQKYLVEEEPDAEAET